MVLSQQASWLFFKARAKRPYLIHTGRASNAEKQPTGCGPEGCVENGPAAALLAPLYARRCTSRLQNSRAEAIDARIVG